MSNEMSISYYYLILFFVIYWIFIEIIMEYFYEYLYVAWQNFFLYHKIDESDLGKCG